MRRREALLFAIGVCVAPVGVGAQTSSLRFAVLPYPPMSVAVAGEGTATYQDGKLLLSFKTIDLRNLPKRNDSEPVDHLAVEVYRGRSPESVARARSPSFPQPRVIPPTGLSVENVSFELPLVLPAEGLSFFLCAMQPSGAYWIGARVDLPRSALGH